MTEEENFIFKIKESDIRNIFSGDCNLNITIQKETETETIKPDKTKVHSMPSFLTNRELEVLQGVAQGKTNEEIAKELFVSRNTIKAHVANILQKLKVDDRLQAVVKAIGEKIIDI